MDVHRKKEEAERLMKVIETSNNISDIDKENIKKFKNKAFAVGLTYTRVCVYLDKLKQLTKRSNIPVSLWGKEEIERVVAEIEKQNYSEHTKSEYKLTIKKFFQIIEGYEWKSQEYPNKVKWIEPKIDKTKLKKLRSSDILTDEDIQVLVKHATSYMQKALISVLFESSTRCGELIPLKKNDIAFEEIENGNGKKQTVCIMHVNGKTGEREIMLVSSVPLLKKWLEMHPLKKEDSPLWIMQVKNRYKMVTYGCVRMMLKRLAERCVLKKPVNLHHFRHSSISKFSEFLSDQQLKLRSGWTRDSKMLSTYSHLTDKHVHNTVLEYYGIRKPENKNNRMKVKSCPICEFNNSFESEYCEKCNNPLTSEARAKMENERVKQEQEKQRKFEEKIRELEKTQQEILKLIAKEPQIIEIMLDKLVEEKLAKLTKN